MHIILMDKISITDFLATDLCVLCGEQFPTAPHDQEAASSQQWMHCFQAVLTIDPHSGPTLTEEALIPYPRHKVDVRILSPNDSEHKPCSQVTISRLGPINMQPAYCFHACCWWSLQIKGQSSSKATPEYMLRLSQSTIPFYLVSWEGYTLKAITTTTTLHRGLEMLAFKKGWIALDASPSTLSKCNNLGLEVLLRTIWKRLPTEIKTMIWEYLEPCAVRCMLFLQLNESHRLINRIGRVPPAAKVSISDVRSVYAYSISIKGSKYLCGFSDGVRRLGYPGEDSGSWVKIPQLITAIKFTLGLYGIQRVKFQGQSEKSEWIGGINTDCAESSWTGIMKFQKRSMIQLFWDDLKLYRIDVFPPTQISFGDQFMWDCDPVSITGAVSSQTWYEGNSTHESQSRLRRVGKWRLMRYLPLIKERSHLYGLTVFCCRSSGITGMEAHFRNCDNQTYTKRVGEYQGCPVHFRMQHMERIVSFWIRCSEWRVPNPFIVVQTNLGRTCTFGPYVEPSLYPFTLLATRRHGTISGIYYDALKIREVAIMSLGLTCIKPQPLDEYEPPPPQYPYPSYPALTEGPECKFKSEASLNHVTAISVCSSSTRCTGMIIRYEDSSESTLGQWYESSKFDHFTIYDPMVHGCLESIRFTLGTYGRRSMIYKISAGETAAGRRCPTNIRNEQTISCKSTVTWWFSERTNLIL